MKSIDQLSSREKNALAILAAFISVTFLWFGVYEPAIDKRDTLIRKIEIKKNELIEARALADALVEQKADFSAFITRLNKQEAGSAPLSEVEALAVAAGIRESITNMSPSPPVMMDKFSETRLEIKMRGISLASLIDFLESLKGSKSEARVNRITIKPQFKDPSLLNLSLTLAFYEAV